MRQLMQSTANSRRAVVFLAAILALVTLFALASGLGSVDLKPAERYILEEEDATAQPMEQLSRTVSDMDPGMQALVIFFLIALFVLFFAILLRRNPKRALKMLLRFGLQLLLIYIFLAYFYQPPEPVEFTGTPVPASTGPGEVGTPVEYVAPEMPQWFVFSVSFVVMSLLGVAGWLTWRSLRPSTSPTLQADLARIARRTVHDLESGHDWGDAVIRCYAEMSEALDHQRGIVRLHSMTPTEFIAHLDRYGMPPDAVRTLTRLFERVRYGGRSSSAEEASDALLCLNQIVAACEVTA